MPRTYFLTDIIHFGKHQGKSLKEIIDSDREYFDWLLKEANEFQPASTVMEYLRIIDKQKETKDLQVMGTLIMKSEKQEDQDQLELF